MNDMTAAVVSMAIDKIIVLAAGIAFGWCWGRLTAKNQDRKGSAA